MQKSKSITDLDMIFTKENMSTNKIDFLTEDYLFQEDKKRNDSIFSITSSLGSSPRQSELNQPALNQEFVELNSNKHSFEKLMRQNLFDLLRCFSLVFTIYYRTNLLVPNSYYRAETRFYLKEFFNDYFQLNSVTHQNSSIETLKFILKNDLFNFKNDNLFENYMLLGNETLKLTFNSKETIASCNSPYEIKEFPFNQICAKFESNNKTDPIDNCQEFKHVYGVESYTAEEQENMSIVSNIWHYFTSLSCVDKIDDELFESDCNGYLVIKSLFK